MANELLNQVKKVNELLKAGEPANVSLDEHSGYTGYKPQFVIDAMNEIFGIGAWGFEEMSNEIVAGDKGGLAIAQVRVWLAGSESHPTGWGQNRVTRGDIGDAHKGAQTDALKKALSYFSVGTRAYQGLLVAGEKGNVQQSRQPQQRPQPQQAKQNITALPSKPAIATSQQLNSLYDAGKAKGLWSSSSMNKFYSFVSGVLDGEPINAESIKSLTVTQYQAVVASVEQEQQAS